MTQSILLINPNTSRQTTHMMLQLMQPHVSDNMELHAITASKGASMIVNDDQLRISEEEVVTIGMQNAGIYSAIIIGAFGDPAIDVLRSNVSIPVIGIGEASLHFAAQHGQFGIATTTPALQESISRYVDKLGLNQQCVGVYIPEGDPLALSQNQDLQEALLSQATQSCINQGAQSVVIGGGPLAESANRLEKRFSLPVISPVVTAIRHACHLLTSHP